MKTAELPPLIVYGRTSKDDKRRLTIDQQQEMLTRWRSLDQSCGALALDAWDVGVSGKVPFPDRPQGKRVVDWVNAHEGTPHVLAVCYVDRFARDTGSGIATAKALNEKGTLLVSIQEGLDARRERSPFQFNLRLCFAEEEWFRIKERMENGKRLAEEKSGAPPGGASQFGFTVGAGGVWHKHPDEAPCVVRCFEMCLEGYTQVEIATWLRSVPGLQFGRRYQKWDGSDPVYVQKDGPRSCSQAFVSKLLRARAYIGERKWGGRIFPVPSLVPLELFERVQAILNGSLHVTSRAARKADPALLSGLLKCGVCGETVHACWKRGPELQRKRCQQKARGIGRGKSGVIGTEGEQEDKRIGWDRYYRCVNRGVGPSACTSRQFKAAPLDEQVWPRLRQMLNNPGELLAKAISTNQEKTAERGALGETQADLLERMKACDDEAAQVWEMQRRNGMPLSFVEEGLKVIQERRAGIVLQLEALRLKARAVAEQQQEVQAITAALSDLRTKADRAESDPSLRRLIAETLVKGGVVHTLKRGRNGATRVELELRWGEVIAAENPGESAGERMGRKDSWHQCQEYLRPETIPLSFVVGGVGA